MPKVSVNIPVYNGETTISRAVQSILSQSFTDFELIIVDDASTDSTPRVLNEFDDPRIKIIRHEKNQGISRTRNTALKNSQGDYIVVLDADDIALPDRIKKQVLALDQDPSLDGAFGWCELFTENPDEPIAYFSPEAEPSEMREMILFQNPFYHSSACIRRNAMGQGYSEDLDCAEDYAKWLELVFSGKRLAILREPLIKYWVHTSTHYSWTRMRANLKMLQCRYFHEIFGRQLSDQEAETHLTLYGLPDPPPSSRQEAMALFSKVEDWVAAVAMLRPRDPKMSRERMNGYARIQFYLTIAQFAPIIGRGILRLSRHYPLGKRLRLLAKSQLPMLARAALFQMNASADAKEKAIAVGLAPLPPRGMLKRIKQATLILLKKSGAAKLVSDSRWRRRRLLILAYHGISLTDEHLWNGSYFMQAGLFRRRLELIRAFGCTVLPFDEAVSRLYSGSLPERAVAITFDDGSRDFYQEAFPILQEFNFPVSLYLTTFYTHYNRPVFDLMCSYLLWKGKGGVLDLKKIIGRESVIDLRSSAARAAAWLQIYLFTHDQKLKAEEKDELLASLAKHLGVDYDSLIQQRVLHNLSAEEIVKLAESGVDIQLHTHRHRTPLDRTLFAREIEENRNSIRQMTGRTASHFCYPSGVTNALFLPWLKESGVISATTCESGLASRKSNPLMLPRLLDTWTLSDVEFAGWLSGISSVLPRRPQPKEFPEAVYH